MNLRQAFREIQAEIIGGNAVILKGPPGFGKTDLMTKVARWFKDQHPGKSVGYSCFFMATQSPIGFTGLPWKGSRKWTNPLTQTEQEYTVTDPAVPLWFQAIDLDTGERRPGNLFDIVLLVIEEWGQGSPETKRAGAEVLRAGGTPPFYLPPGSPRIALSNVDAADGVTKEYDFIIGRRGEKTINGDVDVWIEDFADRPYVWQGKKWQVMPVTKVWARTNPGVLFENKPKEQGPWCNPRTLTACDRYVQAITELNGGVTPVNDGSFMESVAGHIGHAGGTSYIGHLQFQLELPPYEDVVKDADGTPVPIKADLQMLMAYELAARVQPDDAQLTAVIHYMTKKPAAPLKGMPKDMAVTFMAALLRRNYKDFLNRPPLQAWISKNANLMTLVGTLSAA